MDLLVLGAAGRTGRHVVGQALASGHDVTAFVRDPGALGITHDRLTVVKGDVLDPGSVTGAVAGKEAVLSALGVQGRGPTTVFSAGMTNVVSAMKSHAVRRVIAISTAGLDPDVEMPLPQRVVATMIVGRLLRNLYRDQALMEEVLARSDTDWTVVRATMLTGRPATRNYRVAVGGSLSRPGRLSRADLAAYMLSCVNDPETYRKKVTISG